MTSLVGGSITNYLSPHVSWSWRFNELYMFLVDFGDLVGVGDLKIRAVIATLVKIKTRCDSVLLSFWQDLGECFRVGELEAPAGNVHFRLSSRPGCHTPCILSLSVA